MTVEDVYEEFRSQRYNVVFNSDGNGDCQFSAIARHLASIGIFRSERTIRDEICQYLEQNRSDTDGFSLEPFVGVPWSQYLASMALNCFQSVSDTVKNSVFIGCRCHGSHSSSAFPTCFKLCTWSLFGRRRDPLCEPCWRAEQEESENNGDGNQDEMTESE